MSRQIIVTQDDGADGGWTFTGEVYEIASDGTKTLVTSTEGNVGGATGLSGWQVFINGASFVLSQMEEWL